MNCEETKGGRGKRYSILSRDGANFPCRRLSMIPERDISLTEQSPFDFSRMDGTRSGSFAVDALPYDDGSNHEATTDAAPGRTEISAIGFQIGFHSRPDEFPCGLLRDRKHEDGSACSMPQIVLHRLLPFSLTKDNIPSIPTILIKPRFFFQGVPNERDVKRKDQCSLVHSFLSILFPRLSYRPPIFISPL